MANLHRFYKQALTVQDNDAWMVHLDDRPLKTPEKNPLRISSKSIADKIVMEWDAQDKVISPETMPVHNIIVTSIDKSAPDIRQAIFNELHPYVGGDLIFYHAPDPVGLKNAQDQIWGKALDEFTALSGIKPDITFDLVALKQSDDYHAYMTDFINQLSDINFTVFQLMTSLSGSPLSSFLFLHGKITAQEFDQIAHVEPDFYQRHYKLEHNDMAPDEIKARKQFGIDLEACDFIMKSIKNQG